MKLTQYIYIAAFFLISVTTTHAATWLPGRTIDSMHMTPDGGSIYVTFDAAIGYPDCPGAEIIALTTSTSRFEEMYASLLRAQAAQTMVEVRSFYVDSICNPSGSNVRSPYLRFLSQ